MIPQLTTLKDVRLICSQVYANPYMMQFICLYKHVDLFIKHNIIQICYFILGLKKWNKNKHRLSE
jgi:hypothetical protein